MKTIPLTQGKVALVDDADFERLNQSKWYALKRRNGYYAVRTLYLGGGQKNRKQRQIYMHNEILKPPPGFETDHRNGNTLNNRRYNLRVATHAQNNANRRPNKNRTSSQYKGVCWHKAAQKWMAYISVNDKLLYLGLFLSELAGARAYDAAAQKHFGEFACLNFKIAG